MNTPAPGDGSGGYPDPGWPGYPGHLPAHAPQPPYGQPPYGQGPPPYGTPLPYPQPAYGAHPGQGYPPALGGNGGGVARPATMWVGMALLILSAAPFLVFGVVSLIWSALAIPVSTLTGGVAASQLEYAVRGALGFGVFVAVLSLAYIALAVVAAVGRSWARTMLAVLTTLFGLWMLVYVAALVAAPEAASVLWLILPIIAVLLASVGGMVVLYLPAHRPFYAIPRR